MNISNLSFILTSVLLTAIAQLFLKLGMNEIGKVEFSLNGIISLFFQAIKNINIYLGLSAFALSMGIWLVVLSRISVSIAYPFVGVGCIFTVLLAYVFLGESLSLYKIMGTLIICFGIFVITRN